MSTTISVCNQLINKKNGGDPKGTRTPVFGVRGRRPRPLDDGASGFPEKDSYCTPEDQLRGKSIHELRSFQTSRLLITGNVEFELNSL